MKTFYTYIYLREDGTPYYVGKGTAQRAFWKHRRISPPPKDRILLQEFPDEDSAFFAEIFLIDYYGRIDLGTGCLRNLTDGGEGASGVRRKPPTQEYLQKLSERVSGEKHPNFGKQLRPETREKIRLKLIGNTNGVGQRSRPMSPEHLEKLRAINKGRKQSPETILKRIKSMTGQKRSPEARRNMSKAQEGNKHNLGKKASPEAIRKRVETRRAGVGYKPSPETVAKITAGLLKYNAERRALSSQITVE